MKKLKWVLAAILALVFACGIFAACDTGSSPSGGTPNAGQNNSGSQNDSGSTTTPDGGSGGTTTPNGGSGSTTTPNGGSGTGSGEGSGTGSGESTGGGSGTGSGESTGGGTGTGSGESTGGGTGTGSGESTGGGSGTGSGEGSGEGSGTGSGEGSGTGSGEGSGEGSGGGESTGGGTGGIDVSGLASKVIACFGDTPDVWEFFPESFRLNDDRAYTGPQTIDFSKDVAVSSIPTAGIGKQLDVVYGSVVQMQSVMGYVNTVYGALNTIGNLYQTFLNGEPENYKLFEGSTDGGALKFRLELDDAQYTLLAKVGPACVELFSDTEGETYGGRAQISDGTALKYEVGDSTLKIALNLVGHVAFQMEFARVETIVTGIFYEGKYASVGSKDFEFSTKALLTYDSRNSYISVAGTSGDFFTGSKGEVVELYDAETGVYLGSKVKETISKIEYNTYWFPLSDIGGIERVKQVTQEKETQIYVNGAAFEAKTVGGLSGKTLSRRYDIEMKKTYYYVKEAEGDGYEKICIEIPMFFVQAEVKDTLAADVKEKNPSLTITDNVPPTVTDALDVCYTVELAAYEEIADAVTVDDIVAFIGENNAYFSKTEE